MVTAPELPSSAEALRNAVQSARSGDVGLAEVWTRIARELREGSTPPLILRWLEAARDRLTLHDVEGVVCAHGRVAVRRQGGPGERFMHSDDRTNCDDPDEARDYLRRRTSEDAATGYAPGGVVLGPGPVELMRDEHLVDRYGHDVAGRDTDPAATAQFDAPPRLRPGLADGLVGTAVIPATADDPELPRCRHCRLSIVFVTPGPDGNEVAGWRHYRTNQAVCPTSHTFAEPEQ